MLIPRHITSLPPVIAFRHICGLMMRPNDPSAAHEFMSMTIAAAALGEDDRSKITLHRDIVQGLIGAAGRGAGKDLQKADKAGSMAGAVLLYVLRGQASNIRDFGVDKAVFLVAEMWRRHRTFQGANDAGKGAGRDTVQTNWDTYRPVAHLWAAYTALVSPSSDPDELRTPEEWACESPERFLAVAQGLLLAGSTCRLPRDGRSLLDPKECWGLEDIEPARPSFFPLRDEERAILDSFAPRFRS